MNSLKPFEYVLALAKEGNFSRAAESLQISQPSLSQYIRGIEREIGQELFNRGNGNLRLTDAGHAFLAASRRILDQERQLKQQLTDINQGTDGEIIIGISPYRCVYLMPEITRRFHKLYPGIRLVIEERMGQELYKDAEDGCFDFCVATLPVDTKIFNAEIIMKEEVILAIRSELPLNKCLKDNSKLVPDRLFPVIQPELLKNAVFVSLSSQQPTQKCLNKMNEEFNLNIHSVIECRSIQSHFSMIRNGLGAGLIPSSISKFNSGDSLSYYSLANEFPSRDVALIYRKDLYLSKAMNALKEIMATL